MSRRAQLVITAPGSLPGSGGLDDPNNYRFYMAPNATDPGATFLKLQATQVAATVTLTTYASAGAADPASNNFPAGSAATLRSQTGGLSFKGDGTGLLGDTLTWTKYRCRATNSANQAIVNNTATKVLLQTKDYDPNANFDNVTNYRYTVPVAGYYRVSGSLNNTPGAQTGGFYAWVRKNGVDVNSVRQTSQSSFQNATQSASFYTEILCAAGDYLELWTYWSGTVGNSTVVGGAGVDSAQFVVQFLGT